LGWGHGALGEGLFKNNGKCSSLSAWDEALGEEDFFKKKRWTAPTAWNLPRVYGFWHSGKTSFPWVASPVALPRVLPSGKASRVHLTLGEAGGSRSGRVMQTLISSTNEQMSNAGKTLLNAFKMATAEASTTRKKGKSSGSTSTRSCALRSSHTRFS
jgi:hypothetical protein